MSSNYLYFVSTELSSIPEEIHYCDDDSIICDSITASVHSTASASLVSMGNRVYDEAKSSSLVSLRNWVQDEAKSNSPARGTNECISNDTAPKAPLRKLSPEAPLRRLSDDFGAECDFPILKIALEAPLRRRLYDDFSAECDIPMAEINAAA